MRYLIILLFIVSCAHHHNHHEHDHNTHGMDLNIDWNKEQDALSADYKNTQVLFQWALANIEDQIGRIKKYESKYQELQQSSKKVDGLHEKKVKLQISRLNLEMQKEHEHFQKDHKSMMQIVHKLKKLKEELQSHEGHNH